MSRAEEKPEPATATAAAVFAPNKHWNNLLDDGQPLHQACKRGDADAITGILESGANPNARTVGEVFVGPFAA